MVLASILNGNLADIKGEIIKLETAGVDAIHYDVMDGIFVDNISFGLPVLSSLKLFTTLPIDVHLMIVDPIRFVERFAKSGADMISFHIESDSDAKKTIEIIHSCGVKAGIAISPDTPIVFLYPILKYLNPDDFVLIMTVYPGLGGQSFIKDMLDKITALAQYRCENNLSFHIEVDGGINDKTGLLCREAGVDYLVSGSYITGSENPAKAVQSLK